MIFRPLLLIVSCVLGFYVSSATAEPPQNVFSIPTTWARRGVVINRQADEGVAGDPCIVWDEAIKGWRMVMFYSPPGHAQAICTNQDDMTAGPWTFEGPLPVTNPDVAGQFHKPFIVMDPDRPNHAAKIEGRYCLLTVVFKNDRKHITRAWSDALAGPWTFEEEPIIPRGNADDFDARHTDAVTGYYFPDRKEFLYFYMGYPIKAQPREISPFGSAQAVATQKLGESVATKHGIILPPRQQAGHWASGWVGGLQIMRGKTHRWVGVANASPTAPDPGKREVWTEEPPPSLGGFAWSDEAWPISGWQFAPEPIEWVKDLPQAAIDGGEGHNLWRQFIHILPDGNAALFYNSGYYGREQLYLKVSQTSPTERITDGLILDLDADKGVEVTDGNRVVKWSNQVRDAKVKNFLPNDIGRKEAGSGRPTRKQNVAAIGGHDTLVFERQELINDDNDALDHLITGGGHTWIAVLCIYKQIVQLEDVNSIFGNLRNGGNFEGIWANVTDDGRLWIGSRNGLSFGRWDTNNPMVTAPKPLNEKQYYVVAGRMGAGTGTVQIEAFINEIKPVAAKPIPVNPKANAERLAIGGERDATNHPGREAFDGEIARLLIYERPLSDSELKQAMTELKATYAIK
jgi:hypothetical protein